MLRALGIFAVLSLAVAFVPTAAASEPLEEACWTVANNPYAPQPMNCGAFGGILGPLPTLKELCEAVANNPYAPQPIGCGR